MNNNKTIIHSYIRLWPRDIYNIKSNNRYLESVKKELFAKPGIYILYKEEKPYYVGQALNLWKRIRRHATSHNSKQFHGWTAFSAFVFEKSEYLDEMEGLLISAFENEIANGAKPKFRKIPLPTNVRKVLSKSKTIHSE